MRTWRVALARKMTTISTTRLMRIQRTGLDGGVRPVVSRNAIRIASTPAPAWDSHHQPGWVAGDVGWRPAGRADAAAGWVEGAVVALVVGWVVADRWRNFCATTSGWE